MRRQAEVAEVPEAQVPVERAAQVPALAPELEEPAAARAEQAALQVERERALVPAVRRDPAQAAAAVARVPVRVARRPSVLARPTIRPSGNDILVSRLKEKGAAGRNPAAPAFLSRCRARGCRSYGLNRLRRNRCFSPGA